MNKHKDMSLWDIWLTKTEQKELQEAFEWMEKLGLRSLAISKIAEIIERANKRRDFQKR